MKKVTNFIVETAMNAMIHTNGQTTSLEVKSMLRAMGYFATQKDVSVKMREVVLSSECIGTYFATDNGTYNVYTFDLDSDVMFNYGFAEDYDENESDASNDVVNTTPDIQLVDRDPEQIRYFADDIDVEDAKWVVFHKDMDLEFHIFDERLTRDNVRSTYATRLGVPIQDVRSKEQKTLSVL